MAEVELNTLGSVIKTAYEGESNTNAYTDTEKSKLASIEDNADVTDATNVRSAGAPIVSSGAGAPSSTPTAVGDIYIDTTNDEAYTAVGTGSSGDWQQNNDGGGGGSVDTSGTPEANDFARFTDADTITGRNAAEVRADLSLEPGIDVLAEQSIGIADDNLLEVDGTPSSGEYARFTANGLEGRNESQFKADYNLEVGVDVQAWDSVLDATTASFTTADETKLDGIEAGADITDTASVRAAGAPIVSSGAGGPVSTPTAVGDIYVDTTNDDAYTAVGTASSGDWQQNNDGGGGGGGVDTTGTPIANDFARFTDADTLEGRSAAEVRADLSLEVGTDVLAQQTVGIADDNLVEVDGTPNANEYARFTANGIEGRTEAELKTDLNLEIGTDVQAHSAVLDATTASFTTADETKLDGIEASADVTDATNVNAAGATMNTDTDVSGNSWVLDEDNLASDSNTQVPTQQSVKAYADALTFNATPDTLVWGNNEIDSAVSSPHAIAPVSDADVWYHVTGSALTSDLTITVTRTNMVEGQPIIIFNNSTFTEDFNVIVSMDSVNRELPAGAGVIGFNSNIDADIKFVGYIGDYPYLPSDDTDEFVSSDSYGLARGRLCETDQKDGSGGSISITQDDKFALELINHDGTATLSSSATKCSWFLWNNTSTSLNVNSGGFTIAGFTGRYVGWTGSAFDVHPAVLLSGTTVNATPYTTTINSTNAETIDDTDHELLLRMTHGAGTVTVTMADTTSVDNEGEILKDTSQTVNVVFGGNAVQVLPDGTTSSAGFELTGGMSWKCLANSGGTSAVYWIEGETDQATSGITLGSDTAFEDGSATLTALGVTTAAKTILDDTSIPNIRTTLEIPEVIMVAVSDEDTALTTGTSKVTFRMPFAMTLSDVRASVTTAPTGSTLIVDINESGSTILSTKLSIDATESTSETAASAAVISDTALADDAEITIDIDQVGATVAGTGLKVQLHGVRA